MTFCKDRDGGCELIVVIKMILHASNVLFLDLLHVKTLQHVLAPFLFTWAQHVKEVKY